MGTGRWIRAAGCVGLVVALACCSLISNKATRMVADTLSAGGTSMTSDNDPELVREAVPFGLKTYESLLESLPKYVPLLRATCSGFTSYAYGYLATDADMVRYTNREVAKAIDERTLKMFLRAHGYCARALEERFKGVTQALLMDPANALTKAKKEDVELLYWSAASWGLAMSMSPETLAIDFPAVRALAERGLALALVTLPYLSFPTHERCKAHADCYLQTNQYSSPLLGYTEWRCAEIHGTMTNVWKARLSAM